LKLFKYGKERFCWSI